MRTAARWVAPLLIAAAIVYVLLLPRVDGATRRGGPAVVVVLMNGVSFEELMSAPAARALAATDGGGAALLVPQPPADDLGPQLRAAVRAEPGRQPRIVEYSQPPAEPAAEVSADLERAIEQAVRGAPPASTVILAGATPSTEMTRRGDGVLPIVVGELPLASGVPAPPPGSLTSDATRRAGIVSSLDVAPTVLLALGRRPPDGLPGAPIEAAASPAPTQLHRRYLAMRRMTVPVQTAAWIYAAIAASALVALLRRRGRASPDVLATCSWLGLSVGPLAAALFAAGHLPSLSYATAIPFVVATTVVGTVAVVPFARVGVLAPVGAMGAGLLTFIIVEALTGFSGALTPLLGGSQLDGGRFYGAPNVLEGLAVGAAIYVAVNMSTGPGVATIAGVALVLGLPQIGADVGGAVVAFSASGLWLAIRRRGRLDLPGLAQAAIVAVAGTALVLSVHRLWPGTPTHATAFVQAGGRDIAATLVARLAAGGRLIATNPFAAIPAVGVVVMAAASAWPPATFADAFAHVPRWRDASLVLSLAGVVALVGNDSGPAAAGLAFGLALGGTLYVSARVASGKMDDGERTTASVD